MTALQEGDLAPDFSFTIDSGAKTQLSEIAKKNPVILYFYPRDFTPGCTQEACDFRDSWAAVKKAGAMIIGVSTDSDQSHKKFIAKLKLPYPLVPDEKKEIVKKYGVFGEKKFLGRTFQGTHRATFIIGRDQKIKKIFRNVKVAGHIEEVLRALDEIE